MPTNFSITICCREYVAQHCLITVNGISSALLGPFFDLMSHRLVFRFLLALRYPRSLQEFSLQVSVVVNECVQVSVYYNECMCACACACCWLLLNIYVTNYGISNNQHTWIIRNFCYFIVVVIVVVAFTLPLHI